MFALVVTRKGDIQMVLVNASENALQQRGNQIDGTTMAWQKGWFGGSGAHSTNDEETTYEIHEVTP